MDARAYGGGTFAAGSTPYVAVALSLPNCTISKQSDIWTREKEIIPERLTNFQQQNSFNVFSLF